MRVGRSITIDGLVLSIFCSTLTAQSPRIDPDCRERLFKEGPPAWEKVLASVRNIEVDGTWVYFAKWIGRDGELGNKDLASNFTFAVDLVESNALLQYHSQKLAKPVHHFFVANKRYAFEVDRPTGQSSFLFDTARKQDERLRDRPHRVDIELDEYRWYVEMGCHLWIKPLLEILNDSDFRMTQAEYIRGEREDSRRVRLEFECLVTKWRPGYQIGGKYWAILNPAQFWQMEESGVEFPDTEESKTREFRCEVLFQQGPDGLPFPERCTVLRHNKEDEQDSNTLTVTFARPRRCTRRPEEFTLPYYGIPETVLEAPPPRPTIRIMLFNLAAIVFIVAVVLYWRMRRSPAHGKKGP